MRVIIQKPDLDTCLTALIMGVTRDDDIVILRGDASEDDLGNSNILCIEVGYSGKIRATQRRACCCSRWCGGVA